MSAKIHELVPEGLDSWVEDDEPAQEGWWCPGCGVEWVTQKDRNTGLCCSSTCARMFYD